MSEVYPVQSGFPEHSGIMIPEVWSGKLLVKFYQATVFGDIANTDWEGEIANQGDTVHIRTTPTITIRDHKIGQKLSYEAPTSDLVDLLIDKGKYWAFTSDDVVKHQADYGYLEDWTRDASEQLKIEIDTSILADVYASAAAANAGASAGIKSSSFNMGATGAPVALTKANVVDYIVDMGTVLDEQNAPESNRWVVIPPWVSNLITKSDLKDASLSGDGESMLRNGRLGMIGRFTLYCSNSLSTVTDGANTPTNMIFGHKSALTFASQLIKNEGPLRIQDSFGDFFRGLQVYGYKVVKEAAMGHFYAYKG